MIKHLDMETLIALSKRRGIIFQASEIYGGIGGFWDFGPYGLEIAKNIKDIWWKNFVYNQPNIVGIDTTIIQSPQLWGASGHIDTFVDPMVDCKNCKLRFRADEVDLKKDCPNCHEKNSFTKPRQFHLMFKTHVGPIEDDSTTAYLRPETAGGIFAQFANVLETSRKKLPFGIAQIGKAFRNEITPSDFIFRTREFEQMELEYFCDPKSATSEYEKWKKFSLDWLKKIGINSKKLKFHEHSKKEKAHYAINSCDIQYDFPFGYKELSGIANRTDFDLKAHIKASGKDLSYFDEKTKQKVIPYVIEPSFGVGRLVLALLHSAFSEEKVNNEERIVLKLSTDIAPVKVAVLPLSKNEKLIPLARKVWTKLNNNYYVEYDETQSIGRRYRRQDEIGTPLCVTIDFESLNDQAVTIRDRDSMRQERVKINNLPEIIDKKLSLRNI